jgi:hypothetical protein
MSFRPDAADAADDLVRGDGYDGCVRSDGEVLQQGENWRTGVPWEEAPRRRLEARFTPYSAVAVGSRGWYSVPGGAAYTVTVESRQHGGILGNS